MSVARNRRVADRIRDELSRILREEVRDPHVGFATVTGVELSPDLRHARVFVSALDDQLEETMLALDRAASFIRRSLARRGGLRFTPSLQFVADRSAATGSRVDRLLQGLEPTGLDDEEGTR
ncbi:MAG TPA: 30S ribosome-binding factor RbfA [Candidatus Polarisedimenticolaceae bacterium]|nr:30S ribosome-binding factor RbfA [Candidatus Polarisedimenticolaceae bacterium]